MTKANYNRPVTVQRPRVAAGVRTYQTRLPNGRYSSNVSVTPGSFIKGAGNGWGDFYENLPAAMRANPGAEVDLTFIR